MLRRIVFALLLPLGACAQIGVPPVGDFWDCWHIHSRDVQMRIRDQVASVTITDVLGNPCPHVVEVQYLFPVPPGAALDEMTLVVDGRELTGQILDAGEARQIYEDIVRRRRDPGLVEYAGYGLYRSSAFPIPPGKRAQMVVHYTTLCPKDGDIVEVSYPASSCRFSVEPVEHFMISADIESQTDILSVYSPTVDFHEERSECNRVRVSYEVSDYRPAEDFQLFYETAQSEVGATFLTWWPNAQEDGYYLLLVSPSPRTAGQAVMAKDVVIVLDRSGSMAGKKIVQARDAAKFVIDNLNANDRFNVLTYSNSVDPLFAETRAATAENLRYARERIDATEASGGTNIYGALDEATRQCNTTWRSHDDTRPAYIIFLTDGLPTVGTTDERSILSDTRMHNDGHARIFAFGVGYDVNVRLLDNLVRDNDGRSGYVKPEESIEEKVASLYAKIKDPVMTDVAMQLDGFGTRDVTPSRLGDLFEGDQLISTGRIYRGQHNSGNSATLTLMAQYCGEDKRFEYPVTVRPGESYSSTRFVEKLWAARQIGTLLDEIQLQGRVEELMDELIFLSKKYGIVTPYTSFLADEHRVVSMHDAPGFKMGVASELHARGGRTSGGEAQKDAAARQQMSRMKSIAPLQSEGMAMQIGASSMENYEANRSTQLEHIRVIGNETLYRNGDMWQTTGTTEIKLEDKDKYMEIQRFSDAYFELVNQNTAEENRVLAAQKEGEKLMLRLRGKVYLIL